MLFDVQPFDPPTLLAVASLLTLVAVFSAWIPARRASRIHPMEALRNE
jgi:putative ABC transport system permease protein